MNRLVDIIIPTYNNYQYLNPCLYSLIKNRSCENLFDILVVNNGHESSCDWIDDPLVTVLNPGSNLGWEGGINYGLKNSRADYVVFMNDDVHIPESSVNWIHYMISHFTDKDVGAVGAGSNVVMGNQNIFVPKKYPIFKAKYLIGFTMMVRKSALIKTGFLDENLPGGDDLDISIRLRQAGYKLIVDRRAFVYHHGFKTGERIRGGSGTAGGWNSFEMQQRTNTALIKKHGLKVWFDTFVEYEDERYDLIKNTEGEIISSLLPKRGKILDLGCGASKTRKDLIGVDLFKKGEVIDTLGSISQADLVCDITELPFKANEVDGIVARHILEHIVDLVKVLYHWRSILKHGGSLYLAVPNHELLNAIPMNIEHVHAFTPESLSKLLSNIGFKDISIYDPKNGVSTILVAQK